MSEVIKLSEYLKIALRIERNETEQDLDANFEKLICEYNSLLRILQDMQEILKGRIQRCE